MGVHEMVVETRNELDRRGWVQDGWVTNDGRVCMFGAYLCAQRQEVNYETTRAVSLTDPGARDLARALGFRSVQDTMLWNDAPGRKLEHLLARLDAAIHDTAPLPVNPLIGVPGYAILGSRLRLQRGAWVRAWHTVTAPLGLRRVGYRVPLTVRFTRWATRRHGDSTPSGQLLSPAVPDAAAAARAEPVSVR